LTELATLNKYEHWHPLSP